MKTALSLLPLLAFPFGLVGFVALWCLVLFLIALVGGWRGLATRFGVPTLPAGTTFWMQSARFGWLANYNNVLTVVVTPDGVGFVPFVLFRVGHEPIFVPFSALSAAESTRMFFTTAAVLRIGPQRIVVYGQAGRAIVAAYQAARG